VRVRLGLERLADPSPRDRHTLAAFALLALGGTFALRWGIRNPLVPATTPYFLAVVAATLAYGFRGGILATASVAGLYVLWGVTRGPGLPGGQIALRTIALVVPWLAFSWVMSLLSRASRERLHGARQLERVHGDLARRAAELEATNGTLERANRNLARSNRDLEQFARVASHDLSEPLRVVAGFARLLEQRAGPRLEAEERAFLATMTGATDRMQDLIDDILAWSTAGSSPLAPVDVDAGALVDEVREALSAALSESGGTLIAEDLPTVLADPRQLRQVFQNLIANALKFRGEEPPRVEIRAVPVPEGWRFHVADNGIGIAPEDAARIFGMFQRLKSRGEYAGTGIGLSICETVVARHGGEIWVEPTPGGGATFCFTIAARVAAPGDEVPPLPQPVADRG
jgi:signal transduction histidine kinase